MSRRTKAKEQGGKREKRGCCWWDFSRPPYCWLGDRVHARWVSDLEPMSGITVSWRRCLPDRHSGSFSLHTWTHEVLRAQAFCFCLFVLPCVVLLTRTWKGGFLCCIAIWQKTRGYSSKQSLNIFFSLDESSFQREKLYPILCLLLNLWRTSHTLPSNNRTLAKENGKT